MNISDGLSYAFIFTEDLSVGTSANEEGYFLLRVPVSVEPISLTVSCLGYSSRSVKVPAIDTIITIELLPAVRLLSEVVVHSTTDSSKEIIKKMLKSVKKNYSHSLYEAEAYYSEAIRQGTKFLKTTDALITLQDRGYGHPMEDHGAILFTVEQLRTNGDGPDLSWMEALQDWFYEKNGVYVLLKDDPLRKKNVFNWFENVGGEQFTETASTTALSFLSSPAFLEGYSFQIDSVVKINDEDVYCISFYNGNAEALSVGEGNLYIKKKDYGLIEYRARLIKTDKEDPIKWNLYAPLKNSILYECHVRYKSHDGRYFLHYMANKSMGNNSGFLTRNNKQGKDGIVYQYRQLIVKTILTKGLKKFKAKDTFPIDEDLADADVEYDKAFWEGQPGSKMDGKLE